MKSLMRILLLPRRRFALPNAISNFTDALPWNRHDADAIAAAFAEGGTYNNPIAGQGLTVEAIGSFGKGVFAAYPDASFESISRRGLSCLPVAGAWHQHRARPDGTPPTGGSVRVPGATFVQVERDKIRSEHVYHDRQIMAEQPGAPATEPA